MPQQKPDQPNRDQRIFLVLYAEEKGIIEGFASDAGMSASAWIRHRLLYARDSFAAMQKLQGKSADDAQG